MTREENIHCARVYLDEARRRRGQGNQGSFFFVLLRWAAKCRIQAGQKEIAVQGDLFA